MSGSNSGSGPATGPGGTSSSGGGEEGGAAGGARGGRGGGGRRGGVGRGAGPGAGRGAGSVSASGDTRPRGAARSRFSVRIEQSGADQRLSQPGVVRRVADEPGELAAGERDVGGQERTGRAFGEQLAVDDTERGVARRPVEAVQRAIERGVHIGER